MLRDSAVYRKSSGWIYTLDKQDFDTEVLAVEYLMNHWGKSRYEAVAYLMRLQDASGCEF